MLLPFRRFIAYDRKTDFHSIATDKLEKDLFSIKNKNQMKNPHSFYLVYVDLHYFISFHFFFFNKFPDKHIFIWCSKVLLFPSSSSFNYVFKKMNWIAIMIHVIHTHAINEFNLQSFVFLYLFLIPVCIKDAVIGYTVSSFFLLLIQFQFEKISFSFHSLLFLFFGCRWGISFSNHIDYNTLQITIYIYTKKKNQKNETKF